MLTINHGGRGLLESESLQCICGAANALIAKLVENAGFDGVWISSFELHAWNRLPDAGILKTNDYSQAIVSIADRINVPILVDGDEGGPSCVDTIRMVREYQKMGAAGLCIEDNPCPKRCSFYGMNTTLEESSIVMGKIRAACDKRLSGDFVVIARTEALIQGHGQRVALERARMYNDAGCDGLLIHSRSSEPGEVLEFADAYHGARLRAPLVCVPTTYNQVTLRQLADAGFSLVIYANYSVRAAVKALEELFCRIGEDGRLSSGNELVVDMERIFDLVYVSELKENMQKYGGEPTAPAR
jgi:phosphoenolpyruvate phosphomutase